MAYAAADLSIQQLEAEHQAVGPSVMRYEASLMLPDPQGPLHRLRSKPTALLGGMQISSGIFSVGIGLLLAITRNMGDSLITLFRVAYLTGIMFICAGVMSVQLFRRPGLLQASLALHLGCAVVSVLALPLLACDLALRNLRLGYFVVEFLALSVLMMEALISALLSLWFYRETRAKASGSSDRPAAGRS